MATLSPRRKRIKELDEIEERKRKWRKAHPMQTEAEHLASIDKLLREMDPIQHRDTYLGGTTRRKPKPTPQPLKPETQRRLDKLNAYFAAEDRRAKARREREIQERIERIDAFMVKHVVPDPDTLDGKIYLQVRAQPAADRDTLHMLYRGWVSDNELYFGGRLALPIITIEPLQNSQANCDITSTPCTIRFDTQTVKRHSKAGLLDIMLHEMVHQSIAQHDGKWAAWDNPTRGHHQRFADICNRIAKQRGWPDCYVDTAASFDKRTSDPRNACYWPPRTHAKDL